MQLTMVTFRDIVNLQVKVKCARRITMVTSCLYYKATIVVCQERGGYQSNFYTDAQKTEEFFVFFDTFSQLCEAKGISAYKACIEMGLNRSAVAKWKTGAMPNGTTIALMAEYFDVSADYLLGKDSSEGEELPALTKKDERDIARRLEATLGALEGDRGSLMFDGEPLDEETRELLRESLKNSLEWSKRMAKKKYTPKKYRKPNE